MPDAVETQSVAEPSNVEEPAPQRSSRNASGRKVTKRPTRTASKRGARAVSTVRLKVGGHTIVLPKSLAANVTAKDKKKLLAIFKRIVKRQKKHSVKKRATKKR
jgi:hypothetical protein